MLNLIGGVNKPGTTVTFNGGGSIHINGVRVNRSLTLALGGIATLLGLRRRR